MNEDNILVESLAAELLTLKRSSQLREFRSRLDHATAQRVIRHPSIPHIDRAAISLALQFGTPPPGQQGREPKAPAGRAWAPKGPCTEAWVFDLP